MAHRKVTEEIKKFMIKRKNDGVSSAKIANEVWERFGVRISEKTVDYHTNPKIRERILQNLKKTSKEKRREHRIISWRESNELLPHVVDLLRKHPEEEVRGILANMNLPDKLIETTIKRARWHKERLEKEYIPRLKAHELHLEGYDLKKIAEVLGISMARARHLHEKARKDAWHINQDFRMHGSAEKTAKATGFPLEYVEGHIKLLKKYKKTHRKKR